MLEKNTYMSHEKKKNSHFPWNAGYFIGILVYELIPI